MFGDSPFRNRAFTTYVSSKVSMTHLDASYKESKLEEPNIDFLQIMYATLTIQKHKQ